MIVYTILKRDGISLLSSGTAFCKTLFRQLFQRKQVGKVIVKTNWVNSISFFSNKHICTSAAIEMCITEVKNSIAQFLQTIYHS
jgi:hypothetical protein